MLRVAAVVLACACTAYTEIYVQTARPSNNDVVRSDPDDVYNIISNMNQEYRSADPIGANMAALSGKRLPENNANLFHFLKLFLDNEKIFAQGNNNRHYVPEHVRYSPEPQYAYPYEPQSDEILQYPDMSMPEEQRQTLLHEIPLSHYVIKNYPKTIQLNAPFPYEQEEYQPQYVRQTTFEKSRSGLWDAPEYSQALSNFDKAVKEIMFHIIQPLLRGSTNVSRFSILMAVIDGMTKTMVRVPWQHYEQEYMANVLGFYQHAKKASHSKKSKMGCILGFVNNNIRRVRKIINSKWVSLLCEASPDLCNNIISAIVEVGDEELKHEAQLLIKSGEAADLYLNTYAPAMNQKAKAVGNLQKFLMMSMGYLKPLIRASSEARRLLPTPLTTVMTATSTNILLYSDFVLELYEFW